MKIISEGTGTNSDFGYVRVDTWNDETTEKIAVHYKAILDLIGEDTEREGLIKSPFRVAKALQFMTQGYNSDPAKIINSALFKEDYKEIVIVKDIDLYSMCEHHMLPIIGRAHV
ncbi:MAG: GTP cyclohydrolase I, partial [Bacteroidales bacterium]|nr:GTP cyclohydrolase I [Bacteroidales bacterium]